jgi:hypothetical protein
MKTTIILNNTSFDLNAQNYGEVAGFPYGADKLPHKRYLIYVRTGHKQLKFTYHTSYQDYLDRRPFTKDDLITAFYNFLSDAYAGEMQYEQFVGEVGYEPENPLAKRLHKALIKANEKWSDLYVGEISEFLNAFADEFPNNI